MAFGSDDDNAAAGASTARLVVVSNRVPVPTGTGHKAAGGLAVALEAALKSHGGVWYGWSGRIVDGPPSPEPEQKRVGEITFAVLDLAQRDYDLYYSGFANRALWPVCHYRLDLIQIDGEDTEGYFRVNDAFATSLVPLLRPDDLVWVHDYHFLPLGKALRDRGAGNRIGFFLHIPWPPPDVASAMPAYATLLEALTAYDVLGFQTQQDAENFGRCLERDGFARHVADGIYETGGRRFLVKAFPIGIDVEAFRRTANRAVRNSVVQRFRASIGERRLVIGVDRLDYSKGIRERVDAFGCFVRSNPKVRGRVTYLQITPKSRSEVPEYRRMQEEVAEEVGSLNGSLGELDWIPVRYLNQTVNHASLAGLYRMASVGLVTPLRDGMNLVAKEFVAAQSPDDPGVLILSRFAGAAHELDGALIVNPYDIEATARAIARAYDMELEERQERWASMSARLPETDVNVWWKHFLSHLETPAAIPAGAETSTPPPAAST
ncbi:alpha,alpha-trehalose-phosphate synthase (UDP-forming) [Salinarimonas soli]|uniref:Trehalose-6-phosphate synthase n=1 Tax=Salinarimonas soli TaxID=1638099 RepID=A0A5B2VGP4_9HYPH|nr:alpha,alpha-trehalose-phosphate synthase (UDP-forming) [Salinarimonas soli]KAA2238281.1 alpha,alpha-trehalose-phosphate synthase (UDP-forming) [Salinarimonas soli]